MVSMSSEVTINEKGVQDVERRMRQKGESPCHKVTCVGADAKVGITSPRSQNRCGALAVVVLVKPSASICIFANTRKFIYVEQ